MRIYIAAPWADRELAAAFAQQCDDREIEITHRWWLVEGEYSDHRKMAECADMDRWGVAQADVLVLLNTRKSEGKAVEQGFALAYRKPIIAVGKLGGESLNVFHHLPEYTWVDNTEDVWEALPNV